MPVRGDERRIDPAAPAAVPVTSGCGGPKINPVTGLSTDYLNHFTEAVMLLELASGIPECVRDLKAWQPKTYAEHFETSGFSNRAAILTAYRAADPSARAALDRTAGLLNALVIRNRKLVLGHPGTPEIETTVRRAATRLRSLIARAAAVINGTPTDALDQDGPQAAIDAMFRR